MNVVIVEDEALAAERLQNILNEADPSVHVSAVQGSVEEAVNYFKTSQPDLVFLDIQLSDGLSFSIFERVKINSPVIFTTAYDQYSIRAFKLNSVDYLLKPVRVEELAESLNKYRSMRSAFIPDIEELLRSVNARESRQYKKRFLVQYGQKIRKVETSEAAYFYAIEKTVLMITHDNTHYPVDYSLDRIQELMDPDVFFRINRKLLINCASIKNMVQYSRSRVKMDLIPPVPNELDAIVSVERSSGFKEWLDR